MNEHSNRRRFIVPVILLIAALGLGVVFAATTGVLNLSGTAVISPNALVTFEDYDLSPYDSRDTIDLTNSYQTINFKVYLDKYGDTKTLSARVYNESNVPVLLGGLSVGTAAPAGITVTWPTGFNNLRLAPGDYSDYYDVVVQWTGSTSMAPGNYAFSATINYAQTT